MEQRTIRVNTNYVAVGKFRQSITIPRAVVREPTARVAKFAVQENCTLEQKDRTVVTAKVITLLCTCAVIVESSINGVVRDVVGRVTTTKKAIFVAAVESFRRAVDHPAVIPKLIARVFRYVATVKYFLEALGHLAVALKPITQELMFAVTIEYFQKRPARLAVVL